jgi:hypothetical protein
LPETPLALSKPAPERNGWYRYPLYCLPGGSGQFYNHHPVRGTLYLALQVIGIAGGYWALHKRDNVWDARYGRGDFNRLEWDKYSREAKSGFGFTLTIYAIGVADCIIDNWKYNRAETR